VVIVFLHPIGHPEEGCLRIFSYAAIYADACRRIPDTHPPVNGLLIRRATAVRSEARGGLTTPPALTVVGADALLGGTSFSPCDIPHVAINALVLSFMGAGVWPLIKTPLHDGCRSEWQFCNALGETE
jgi:hypothetical protein